MAIWPMDLLKGRRSVRREYEEVEGQMSTTRAEASSLRVSSRGRCGYGIVFVSQLCFKKEEDEEDWRDEKRMKRKKRNKRKKKRMEIRKRKWR